VNEASGGSVLVLPGVNAWAREKNLGSDSD